MQQQQQEQLEAQPETEVTIGGDDDEDVGGVTDDETIQVSGIEFQYIINSSSFVHRKKIILAYALKNGLFKKNSSKQ